MSSPVGTFACLIRKYLIKGNTAHNRACRSLLEGGLTYTKRKVPSVCLAGCSKLRYHTARRPQFAARCALEVPCSAYCQFPRAGETRMRNDPIVARRTSMVEATRLTSELREVICRPALRWLIDASCILAAGRNGRRRSREESLGAERVVRPVVDTASDSSKSSIAIGEGTAS